MAKNWNIREFAEVVANGGDAKKEAIADAGKRFPLAANLVSSIVATSAKDDFVEFASALPDWVTMRKVESVLKDGVSAPAEEETEEVEEEKVEKPKRGRAKKAAKEEAPEEVAEEAEEEEEAPKKAKKAKAKKEKAEKPAKKAKAAKKVEEEPEEEEEDEWEI